MAPFLFTRIMFISFTSLKEMNQRTEALKGRARERSEQKEAGTEPPNGGELGGAKRQPPLFFANYA
jgi:hypothetical protein